MNQKLLLNSVWQQIQNQPNIQRLTHQMRFNHRTIGDKNTDDSPKLPRRINKIASMLHCLTTSHSIVIVVRPEESIKCGQSIQTFRHFSWEHSDKLINTSSVVISSDVSHGIFIETSLRFRRKKSHGSFENKWWTTIDRIQRLLNIHLTSLSSSVTQLFTRTSDKRAKTIRQMVRHSFMLNSNWSFRIHSIV